MAVGPIGYAHRSAAHARRPLAPLASALSPPFPTGIADRVLRNPFNSAWDGRLTEIAAQRASLQQVLEAGAQAQDPAVVDISAGVAVGLLHALEPAGVIVQRIVTEAEALLRHGAAMVLQPKP